MLGPQLLSLVKASVSIGAPQIAATRPEGARGRCRPRLLSTTVTSDLCRAHTSRTIVWARTVATRPALTVPRRDRRLPNSTNNLAFENARLHGREVLERCGRP